MSGYMLSPSLAQAADDPLLIAVVRREDAARTTPGHSHARGQLLGALHGLLSVDMEAGQWVVPAIHAVWIPPHHRHGLRSHGPFSGWSVYVAEPACGLLPARPCTMRMSGLLREAVGRASGWPAGALGPAQRRLAGVILDEIRGMPREPLGLPMPADARLQRVTRMLLDDLADPRRQEDWAKVAGLSVRSLARHFAEETGFGFNEWRQRARLLRALELLASGRAVTAVALDLGYANASAFIDMFRRTLGTTPARYFAGEATTPAGTAA
ncbi:AraC family transcriptional regulator [Frateuria sp. Soil773]|uniref:AraC family transcriptional regulator n=1 Tax=Frateuria sp. Soil773 TaxID=1736407 RepID=UPI0006FE990B|nr:helix-turn-helix transcriptional regulator [Frateuria sp. Soil773]KRE90078.1 AraC family transcriptional regulator [Frateuria sp. Soil773]